MNKLDLQKVIREEVKKSLNETYRDAKENVAILHAMMKKGGKDAKRAKEIVKDIKDELSVIMSTTDPKANLKLVNKVPELDEYLDDAIEMALDDGMGRVRGMYSMSGMREATATKDDLDKIGDYVMSSPTFEYASPSKIKTAIKDMHSEWKAVAKNYKNIEEYFEEMEEMGDDQFMESKKPSKSKKTLKEGYAWERGERKFGQPLPTLASVQKAYQAKQNITEGALLKAIKPGLEGEVKAAVQALETMLASQLTPAGLARNARELAELVIDIIDAAKNDETGSYDDPF
jgi:hypothetical protein